MEEREKKSRVDFQRNGLDINLSVFFNSAQIKKVHLNKLLCCALLVKEKVHTFFFTKKEESVLQSFFFVLLLHC